MHYPLALPIVVEKEMPLLFREWTPHSQMEYDIYKTPIPVKENKIVRPDILLIPMLGYSESGFRLGYGGGFYDRTIKADRRYSKFPIKIGVSFDS